MEQVDLDLWPVEGLRRPKCGVPPGGLSAPLQIDKLHTQENRVK